MRNRAIIVATDGTEAGTAAVVWAAHEAQCRQLPLRIVHVYDGEPDEARYDIGAEYLDVGRSLAEAVSAAAFGRARAVAPGIEIRPEIRVGRTAPELLAASEDAELVALGHRGRGGRRLGSVIRRVTTHARCPVAVVHHTAAPQGRIVAGIGDAEKADHVLETAFAEAAAHDCALTVVRSYLPVLPPWLGNVRADQIDTPDQDNAEHARLAELLAPWRRKYPEVRIQVSVTHDSPAAALAAVSDGARMVIVGSHGHSALAEAMLGSTSHHLLHHANCPVYLVRPRPADGARR